MRAYVVESTAAGTAAISVLEVVGPDAREALARAFGLRTFHEDHPLHTAIADPEGELDDVIVACRPPEMSMTGWPQVEIQCHGSPAIVKRVRRALVRAGAVPAPRTFLLRAAVRNARMTRLEEEAWIAAMSALTERAASELWEQRTRLPALARTVGETRDRDLLRRLAQTWSYGNALARPRRVAVVGAPNSGKSSLVNALAGRDRVLVHPRPGTTRDVVEVPVSIDGVPLLMIDTAGVRDAADPVEREGVSRALREARRAALRIVCVDSPDAPVDAPIAPFIRVVTKADSRQEGGRRGLEVSSKTGLGLDELEGLVLRFLELDAPRHVGRAFLFTPRQVKRVGELLDAAEGEWQERWERWVWGRPRSER